MTNYLDTVISQFRNSPRLLALIKGFNEQIDPQKAIEDFVYWVFDLRTAGTWGLDNFWGPFLDVPRKFTGDDGATRVLSNDEYRRLLFLKAAANITDCSMPDLNRIIKRLFEDRGEAFVIKAGTKYLRYVFAFLLEPWERSMLRTADVMPVPAAVGYEILEYDPESTFGFYVDSLPDDEQPWQPFDQGTFADVYYEF